MNSPDTQHPNHPPAREAQLAAEHRNTGASLTDTHLNEDQFAAFALVGTPDSAAIRAGHFDGELEFDPDSGIDSAALAHLAACSHCREDLARFTESLASFNHLSLAWAESRPAHPSVAHATLLGRLRGPWLPRAAWALAVCTLLIALFFSSPRLNHDEPTVASTGASSTQDSDAEIANDNQLMSRVTVELSRPERSPVAEYGIASNDSSAARSHKATPRSARPESRLD